MIILAIAITITRPGSKGGSRDRDPGSEGKTDG